MSRWTSDLTLVGKGARREVKDLLSELQAEGGWTGCVGGAHIRLRHTSGATYVMARTPSDQRAHVNSRADIRRLLRAAQQ